MMFERAEILKSFDGTDLYFRCFTPRRRPSKSAPVNGVVLAVHGLGENSAQYANLASIACANNIALAVFDLRGHGQSGPRRGDVENLHALVLDIVYVVNHTRKILGVRDDSFFGLFGHSFGAVLLTYVASVLSRTCPPIFMSSPAWHVVQKMPLWKKVATKSMTRVVPIISIPFQLPFFQQVVRGVEEDTIPGMSSTAEVGPAGKSKTVDIFSLSARYGDIFLKATNESLLKHAIGQVETPVTIVCGTEDELFDMERVKAQLPLFATEKTSLTFVEGAGHNIFDEEGEVREQAVVLFKKWLEARGEV